MAEVLTLDVNNLMRERVGKHGLTRAGLNKMRARAAEVSKAVQAGRNSGWLRWMNLPHNQDSVVDEILRLKDRMAGDVTDFVVIGIGGSALGNIAVQAALNLPYWNTLPAAKRKRRPRLWVLDNIDPLRLKTVMGQLRWESAVFNVITKSGSTAETMGQFYIIYDELVRRLGVKKARKRIIATTDVKKGALRKYVDSESWASLIVPDGVGGRFSVLSPVGLVPAAFLGADIRGLLRGAALMDECCRKHEIWENPALLNAAALFLFMQKKKNIHVMMPYSDSLAYVGDWYAQLWAESLGKKAERDGKTKHVGQTPLKALGATDQHSQVQLYAEGPFDKVFTFLAVKEASVDVPFPGGKITRNIEAGYFRGHTLGELFEAERLGTALALTEAGRPNETITLKKLDEDALGRLLYFFEMQTAYAGEFLGINTFDQPGVEAGKERAYALLGRPGFEDVRKKIESAPPPDERYIL